MNGIYTSLDSYAAFPSGVQGTTIANAASVARHLGVLTQQVSDGLISDTYAGLGAGLQTALTTGPAIAQQKAWQSNVGAVTGSIQVAQTALGQISALASQFYAQTDNLNGLNASEVDSIAASARSGLQQVASLLNSSNGSAYVFSGQDSTNPPVPSGDGILTSGFYQQIQAAVGALGAAGGPATISATLAIAASDVSGTSPFAAGLTPTATDARPVVVGEGGQVVPVGILANANADVQSTGGSTTGGYMRDILRGLATLGSLSSMQVGNAGFAQLVADTRTSLGGAITALNADAGVLGDRQTQLQTASQTSLAIVTALQSQQAGAQSVDMAATISALSRTQTQLQASYQLIAQSQSLSLVKYLSTSGG